MSSYPTFTDADGRYLQLSGGAMATNSSITIAGTTYDSLMASDVFGVEKTSDSTQNASLGYSTVTINSTSSGSYGTTTNAGQMTSSALTLTQSGTDSYGTITNTATFGLGGLGLGSTGGVSNSTLTVEANGITATGTNFGTTTSFSLDPTNGVQWNNGSVNGQFGPSGLRFADGTTQTTAYTCGGGGGGTPPYSEAVWIYNNWYSATIQTVYTTSYSYVNVLTF
jgi:hypothetical protein